MLNDTKINWLNPGGGNPPKATLLRRRGLGGFNFVNRFAPALCPVADGSPVDESGLDDDLVGARSLAVTVAFQALRKLAKRWATTDPLGGSL